MDHVMLIKIIIIIAWLAIGEITWRILYYTPIKFFHKEYSIYADDEACQLTRKIRPLTITLGVFSLLSAIFLLYASKEARPLFFKHGLTLYYRVPDETKQETAGKDVV